MAEGLLRVAQVMPGPTDPPGALAIARALARQPGIAQVVFALGPQDGMAKADGLEIRVLRNGNPAANPLAGVSGRFHDLFAGVDLVHVHQSLSTFGTFAAAVAVACGKTLVLTDHGGRGNSLMTTGRGLALACGIVSVSAAAHALAAPLFRGPLLLLDGGEAAIGPALAAFYAGLRQGAGCGS